MGQFSSEKDSYRGGPCNGANHHDDDDAADKGDDRRGNIEPACSIGDSKNGGGEKTSHQRTQHAQDNVADRAVARTMQDQPCQPAPKPVITQTRTPIERQSFVGSE